VPIREHANRLDRLADEAQAVTLALGRARLDVALNLPQVREVLENDLKVGSRSSVQLEYPDPRKSCKEVEDAAASLEFGRTWIDDLLRARVDEQVDGARRPSRHDGEVITRLSLETYGTVTQILLAEAREILSEPDVFEPPLPEFDTAEAAQFVRTELDRKGLKSWTVEIDNRMTARMSVSGPNNRVRIRARSAFSAGELERLAIHEVGTHVMRYVNGERQPLRLLRIPLQSYIRTEEGLAVFNENRAGVLSFSDRRKYAARVVAADAALSGSMLDAYEAIVGAVGHEMAFDIALRSKRGFTDLNEPGAHLKDIVYLAGFLDVASLEAEQPGSVDRLMTCKQAIDFLPRLSDLESEGLWSPPV